MWKNFSINVNINKDDHSINDYLYCLSEFGQIPNKISLFNTYKINEFLDYISTISTLQNISREIIPNGNTQVIDEKNLVKVDDGIYISFVCYDKGSDFSKITDMVIYFKNGEKKVDEIIESLNKHISYQEDDIQHKFNTLTISGDGLTIEPIEPMNYDYDNMNLYYNHDTFKKSKKIIKSIRKNNKGLSVFFGERGVGKTSLVSYIVSNLDRICIFIPSNMIDITINSNEFKSIISRYKNSIIVIDDCEIFFSNAYTKSNIFTNNLLQMVDGVSSDMNNIHVIAILNTPDFNDIDPLLLDCNNFIDIVEVGRLDSDSSQALCKHVNQKNKIKSPRLIDVLKKRKTSDIIEMGF